MTNYTLENEWTALVEVIRKDLSTTQLREMKKAFFAGAASLLTLLVSIHDDASDYEGCLFLTKIDEEIQNYFSAEWDQYNKSKP